MTPQGAESGRTEEWIPVELRSQPRAEESATPAGEWTDAPLAAPVPELEPEDDVERRTGEAPPSDRREHATEAGEQEGKEAPQRSAREALPPRQRVAREFRARLARFAEGSRPEPQSRTAAPPPPDAGEENSEAREECAPGAASELETLRNRVDLELASFASSVEGVDAVVRRTRSELLEVVERRLASIEASLAANEAAIARLADQQEESARQLAPRHPGEGAGPAGAEL